MRVMHIITNMMGTGGAEVMLLRLASAIGGERPIIVSLMDVSERHRQVIADHDLDVRPLKVRSTAGMMKSVLTVRQLIRNERPDALMCWLYHAMVVGQVAVDCQRQTMRQLQLGQAFVEIGGAFNQHERRA